MHLLPRPLAFAACLILGLAGPAFAQGTAEQRDACTPDALKLCSDTIPDVARTTACMKRHEAELSPRCQAVFELPDGGEPAATRGREVRRARRDVDPGDEPSPPASRGERRAADAPDGYDAPSRRGGGDYEDEPRGAPGGEGAGSGIRYFPPGDAPDEAGGPPYGNGDGPRYGGPRDRDGPHSADRGDPDDRGRPGHGRFDSPGFDRDDYGAGSGDRPPPRQPSRRAGAVIARLCAAGEIDPRTCAVTRRALQRRD